MSNSIINYKNKYFNPDDSVLIMSLCQLKGNLKNVKETNWLNDFFIDVVSPIIEDKPIGWCDLELDKYFDSDDKNLFFINLVKYTISKLISREKNIIEYEEVNNLFKLEGIEKWGVKNYFLIDDIVICLNDLILLLDNNITYEDSRLRFYNMS